MLIDYLTIALRQLKKHKGFAAINIFGLAVGMTVFVLGTLIVRYEYSHDTNWRDADRIYTAGTLFGPAANIGIAETDGIYTAFAPFIDTEVADVEAIARVVGREFLVSIEDDHYYEELRFTDPQLLDIFDFDYIEGDASALTDPLSVVVTRSMRDKLFGEGAAVGRTLELDHNVVLHVTAVIEDLPGDTHFSSSLIAREEFHMFAPLEALNRATEYDVAGNFNNLSMGDRTYMRLAPGKDGAWLQNAVDGVFERHYPNEDRTFITGINVRPLVEANTMIWDAIGLPIVDSVQLLSILVLIIAIVNYTNLATAQSLGRAREIGLRKTLGANRGQLVTQFITESVCVALLAMLLTAILLALLVPGFNEVTGKDLQLDWMMALPMLVGTAVIVGVLAGLYPAFLISRTQPIDALRGGQAATKSGAAFRSGMLILQFGISILMLAMVAVVFLQNERVVRASEIYPKTQIIMLSRLNLDPIRERFDALHGEITRLPGVASMTFSSHIPFEQSNSSTTITPEAGNEEAVFIMNQIWIDEHFLPTYEIPLLAGRNFDRAISGDTVNENAANVIVNELALQKLGFGSPDQAVGRVYYESRDEGEPRVHTIVGVIPDQNFQGFHNVVKPTMFKVARDAWFYGSIKASTPQLARVREGVERVWQDLVPDYPIQSSYLQDEFDDTYQVYNGIAVLIGGFAMLAMTLSLIGLFGLAAFLAAGRTKEIGIRKVMGASTGQIARLLVWRFSRPVMWALVFALPLAYLASQQFLNFFADRIGMVEVIVLLAGLVGVVVSWLVVAVHAIRVARTNPIVALRYE